MRFYAPSARLAGLVSCGREHHWPDQAAGAPFGSPVGFSWPPATLPTFLRRARNESLVRARPPAGSLPGDGFQCRARGPAWRWWRLELRRLRLHQRAFRREVIAELAVSAVVRFRAAADTVRQSRQEPHCAPRARLFE